MVPQADGGLGPPRQPEVPNSPGQLLPARLGQVPEGRDQRETAAGIPVDLLRRPQKQEGIHDVTERLRLTAGKESPFTVEEVLTFHDGEDGQLRGENTVRRFTGRALVDAYYRTAPAIVTAMELCQDTEAVCGRIWRDYLAPCLEDVLVLGDGLFSGRRPALRQGVQAGRSRLVDLLLILRSDGPPEGVRQIGV